MKEGARRLGILSNDDFVFDSEDQTNVLMDYCIYNVYQRRPQCNPEVSRASRHASAIPMKCCSFRPG